MMCEGFEFLLSWDRSLIRSMSLRRRNRLQTETATILWLSSVMTSTTATSHAIEPRYRKIFEERAQQTLKSSYSSEKWKRQVKFTRGCKAHPSILLPLLPCFPRYWNVLIKGTLFILLGKK